MKFKSGWWSIDLAKGWTASAGNPCGTIVKSGPSGTLQISAFQKTEGPLTRKELLKFAKLDPEDPRPLEAWGDFEGFQVKYDDREEGLYWRKLWLVSVQVLLFVIYNCDYRLKKAEKADIDQMLGSLTAGGRASLSEQSALSETQA